MIVGVISPSYLCHHEERDKEEIMEGNGSCPECCSCDNQHAPFRTHVCSFRDRKGEQDDQQGGDYSIGIDENTVACISPFKLVHGFRATCEYFPRFYVSVKLLLKLIVYTVVSLYLAIITDG